MIFLLTALSLSLLGVFPRKSRAGYKLEAGKLALRRDEVPVPWTGASILLNDRRVRQSHFPGSQSVLFAVCWLGLLLIPRSCGCSLNGRRKSQTLKWSDYVWVYSLSRTWYNHNTQKDGTGGVWARGGRKRDGKGGCVPWRWKKQVWAREAGWPLEARKPRKG